MGLLKIGHHYSGYINMCSGLYKIKIKISHFLNYTYKCYVYKYDHWTNSKENS